MRPSGSHAIPPTFGSNPSGRTHAYFAGLAGERARRDDFELARSGAFPGELQSPAAVGLEVMDRERVLAGGELDLRVLRRHRVETVVVDRGLPVDRERSAVVAREAQRVLPRLIDDEEAVHDGDEGVLHPLGALVLVAHQVEHRQDLGDVRRLAGHQREDLLHRLADEVEAQGESVFAGSGCRSRCR
jgi:hypothetical protein